MDAPSRGISRRTCMGMMMSALLGCRGSATLHAESPPEIAITIDDFDLNASTPLLDPDARNALLLDTLRAMRVQAAAFVCGKRVDNPDGRRRLALWSDAGHMLANHTYSHWHYHGTDFEKFSAASHEAPAVSRCGEIISLGFAREPRIDPLLKGLCHSNSWTERDPPYEMVVSRAISLP